MTLWAIVPVKPLRRGKSRLAAALSLAEREALGRALLTRTLGTLRACEHVAVTLVVSHDLQALALARRCGVRTIGEGRKAPLNRSLDAAARTARRFGAHAVLVLPADLPLLSGEDLEALAAQADEPPVAAIAPDRRGAGTNALLLSPPGLIEYAFGTDSYAVHRARARAAGARVEVIDLPGLRLDLDLPEDLELLRAARSTVLPERLME